MEVEAVHTPGNTWGHNAVNERLPLREAIEALEPGLGSWPENTYQDFSYGMLGNLNRLCRRGLLRTSRNSDNHITWSVAP